MKTNNRNSTKLEKMNKRKERKKNKVEKNKIRKENRTKKRKNKKNDNFIVSFLKILIKILFSPFILLRELYKGIKKGMRFSISFKITASYVGIYIIILFVVIILSAVGYFIYRISVLDNQSELYFDAAVKLYEENKDFNEVIISPDINVDIFDKNLDILMSTDDDKNNIYVNDIIAKIERIIDKKEYSYSNKYYTKKGEVYYVNIHNSIDDIYHETYVIILFTSLAGFIGILLLISVGPGASKKVVEPIKNMTEVAKTISVNNINTRLNVQSTQDELRELSNTFNEMMDRIEEGYNSQKRFVSDASHELRTPISVIKGYVNMLDRWGKNDKEILEESINALKNEADNMQDLVEKLLFIARSDKNTIKLNRKDIEIIELLNEVKKESEMIDHGHKYHFDFRHNAIIYADKNRIKQAIRILIENAIKFTPDNGEISIYGYIEKSYYVINVKDTGIGISKKDMKKIFERFYRAEESRNKEAGGHGLGLSIAKIIILSHKGKIKLKSKLGDGSQFMIYLPYIKIKEKI